MQKTEKRVTKRGGVNIKSIALPSEHGGWGLLAGSILLGLLVAFSWLGLLLAVAACGVFLIHQPLKIALKDRLKGRRPPRTVWATRFAIGYGLLVVVPMTILLTRASPTFLIPILLAVPLALVQLYYDVRNRSRRLLPEVCGALALAMIAPAIAVLAGWTLWLALPLWLLLALRAVPAILYVRARLRLRFNKPVNVPLVWLVHVVALLVVIGLGVGQLMPLIVILPFIILLGRALVGLSKYRQAVAIKVIGFQELAYGLMTVVVIAIGYGLA